jgi:HEAT repeat protein
VEASFDGKPVSYWIEALKSPDAKTRVAAASAIAKIGPPAKSAVPALIDALKDDEKLVRTESIAALGKIGPAAADAVPMLIKLADDNDWATQSLASAAIAAIQGKPPPDKGAPDTSRGAKPRKKRRAS